MELWIRTQDKEMLLKTTSLCMEIQNDVDPKLHTFNIFANGIRVGNYKSKERAIAILDEIQQYLASGHIVLPTSNFGNINTTQLDVINKIYEMPKE